ncbi:MAG: hypothetical protein F4X72_01695 [Dehalococcoidia bacterium]|nr:hypothetical protein [Dehalococcoidia bacterium]
MLETNPEGLAERWNAIFPKLKDLFQSPPRLHLLDVIFKTSQTASRRPVIVWHFVDLGENINKGCKDN